MSSLDTFARAKLDVLQAQHRARQLHPTQRDGVVVRRHEHTYVSFSCNDYLGLAHHPDVVGAMQAALDDGEGAGAGGSRLVTGNAVGYARLEAQLATLKGTEASVVFGSGYLANLAVLPAFVGASDLVVIDALAHACMMSAAKLSGARIEVVPHNNVDAVDAVLRRLRTSVRHVVVATEGVFSMDGDTAPLVDLQAVCDAHDAWLLVDDAHGFGVLGDGRGTAHAQGAHVQLQVGTLSKAAGGYGGFLAASDVVVELMHSRGRPLVYSTGLPPAVVAGNVAAVSLIANDVDRCRRPLQLARRFTTALGLPDAESAIVPVVIGSERDALDAQARLQEDGLLVTAIRPPTVPDGTARLRVGFSAAHDDAHIAHLIEAIRGLPQLSTRSRS